MRREAVASSKIEGTVTTLTELFLFEVDQDKSPAPGDAREVFNYVRALDFALNQLDTLPISSRLIKETHRILMSRVEKHRGSAIVPGEFRSDQNWIGARVIRECPLCSAAAYPSRGSNVRPRKIHQWNGQ